MSAQDYAASVQPSYSTNANAYNAYQWPTAINSINTLNTLGTYNPYNNYTTTTTPMNSAYSGFRVSGGISPIGEFLELPKRIFPPFVVTSPCRWKSKCLRWKHWHDPLRHIGVNSISVARFVMWRWRSTTNKFRTGKFRDLDEILYHYN